MEEARRKLRICLIFVVLAAVLVGCIYYFGDKKNTNHMNEGTLVMTQMQKGNEGMAYGVG